MKRVMTAVVLIVIAGLVAGADAAGPPAPPHPAGTICFTPQFWCFAQPPGPVGTRCACPTPYGLVAGFRG
jgi:hypothetical protein